MSSSIRHPKPAEGEIAGSQSSDKPLASTPAEGLAVAPVAEQSAPAADEIIASGKGGRHRSVMTDGRYMALDDFNPTRAARQITMVILLRNEGPGLEGYVPERDFVAMIDAMRNGWREILNIWAGAMIHCRRVERNRGQLE